MYFVFFLETITIDTPNDVHRKYGDLTYYFVDDDKQWMMNKFTPTFLGIPGNIRAISQQVSYLNFFNVAFTCKRLRSEAVFVCLTKNLNQSINYQTELSLEYFSTYPRFVSGLNHQGSDNFVESIAFHI